MANVAFLHYTAPPIVGGVESVIENHARLFASKGHAVRVIAGRGQSFDRRVQFIPFPLVDSRHSRILSAKVALDRGQVPESFSSIVSELVERLSLALEGVDVLFAHNVCSLHKNLALTAALRQISNPKSTLRIVAWHHDLASSSFRYRGELHNGYPWDLLTQPWPGLIQVTISAERRRQLCELLGLSLDQIRIIPNGVDPARFLHLGDEAVQIADTLNLWQASPLLLLPARLTARKNIELALQVASCLRDRMPAASLLITGPLGAHNPANEAYFDKLKKLGSELQLEGAVHFLAEQVQRYIPDETIAELYRLADCLIFPSREEGFGIPILEAGLARMPIFCTDIPPLRELGQEEAHYFSTDAEPSQIADLIASSLLGNRAYRLRKRVLSFTWQQIYTEHLDPLIQR